MSPYSLRFFSLVVLLSGLALYADTARSQAVRKYENEFLSIGAGARALSMGKSVFASENGATAAYWNPAGILESTHLMEASLMHAGFFAGLQNYDYLGTIYQVDSLSSVGFSLIRSGVDDIPNTLELVDANGDFDYDKISYFSVADYAFVFTYARRLPVKGLSLGANAKVIYRHQGDFANALGFGFDVGIHYKSNKWQFSALLRDATSTFTVWMFDQDALSVSNPTDSTENTIPENTLTLALPGLHLGASRYLQLNAKFGLLAEAALNMTFDGKRNSLVRSEILSMDPVIGLEVDFQRIIFLRAGLNNLQQIDQYGTNNWQIQPNVGLGLNFRRWSVDYALSDLGSQVLAYSNIFSFRYRFNLSAPARN